MKTMTCNQLGGACDHEFKANTFDEQAEQSRNHAMEMLVQADGPHLEAMGKMQAIMQEPGGLEKWMESKKAEFSALPHDSE